MGCKQMDKKRYSSVKRQRGEAEYKAMLSFLFNAQIVLTAILKAGILITVL